MKSLVFIISLLFSAITCMARDAVYLNENVTTHVILPENITMVDLSTDLVAGNQCNDNIVRMKPIFETDSLGHEIKPQDGQILGVVTIIGERNIVDYQLVYRSVLAEVEPVVIVAAGDMTSYINPMVSMPKDLIALYAWSIFTSGRKFHNINSSDNGIKAMINNIYSVGNYFFIDYSLINKTNIPYDIADVRVKLTDKKQSKATNVQAIEIDPVFTLNNAKQFNKSFRNVIVIDKLTFPNEKVLNLEISENQISGRVISLSMEYSDILNADSFSSDLLKTLESAQIVELNK